MTDSRSQAATEGLWQVSIDQGPPPTVVKFRTDVTCPDPERPFMITVGVMFNAQAENGMPDMSIEGEFLAGVEKDLQRNLPSHGAIHVLSVTSHGNREWFAYAPSHDWMQTWAPDFASRWFDHHTFKISAAKDADWAAYRAFSGRQ